MIKKPFIIILLSVMLFAVVAVNFSSDETDARTVMFHGRKTVPEDNHWYCTCPYSNHDSCGCALGPDFPTPW